MRSCENVTTMMRVENEAEIIIIYYYYYYSFLSAIYLGGNLLRRTDKVKNRNKEKVIKL